MNVGALPSAQTVCTAMNVLPVTVPADGTVAEALAATTAEQAAVRAHPFARQEALARRLAQLTGGQLFGAQVNVVPFELELRLGAATGAVHDAVVRLARAMSARPVHGPRRRSTTRLGAFGKAGKSWGEKNDIGASTLDSVAGGSGEISGGKNARKQFHGLSSLGWIDVALTVSCQVGLSNPHVTARPAQSPFYF